MTQQLDPTIQTLLQMISQPRQLQGPSPDLAKFILARSSVTFNIPSPIDMGSDHKPSLLGRIADVLSRPNYAVANMFHSAANQKNPLAGFWQGLSGKEKTTFSKVLEDDLGVTNPVAQGIGGLALDVAADPTTYIGAGVIKKGLSTVANKTGIKNSGLGKKLSTAGELPEKPTSLSDASDLSSFFSRSNNAIPTDIGEFFKKADNALPTDVDSFFRDSKKASPEAQDIVSRGAEVVPSVAPKIKPEITLSPFEQSITDVSLKRLAGKPTLNPLDQLNLWKSLLENAKSIHVTKSKAATNVAKNESTRVGSAYNMYRHIEDILSQQGVKFEYWDGSELKLSDVLSELPQGRKGHIHSIEQFIPEVERALKEKSGRISDPNVAQSIHNVRVRNAIIDSKPVDEAIRAILKEKQAVGQQPLSDARLQKLYDSLPALAERHATELGASVSGSGSARALAKQVVKEDTTPVGVVVKRVSKKIDAALRSGTIKKAPEINAPVTHALIEEMDIPRSDFKAPLSGKGGVMDTILGRIFAWYGQKDLRQITEQHLLSATNSSWLRTASIKDIAKNYTREQHLQAMRYAQGLDSEATNLGSAFKASLENLFRGTGLTDSAWRGQSVAEKSGLLMDRINRHLRFTKAPWQFTRGEVIHPITGMKMDFSEGMNWLTSWRAWDIKDPLEFFQKVQGAVETAVHEKAILDDVAERFGSSVAGNGYFTKVNHPYLNGYYFTKDIAEQIPRVIKDMDSFYIAGASNPFLQQFDKISRLWKFAVTLPNPSHHIRNLLGDAYMSWMAGVNTLKPYEYAAQIMRSQGGRYKELNNVELLTALDAIPRAMAKSPDAKDVLFKNKSGHSFSAEQIFVAANNMGILPQAHVIEDLLGQTSSKTMLSGIKSKLEHFSETREHFSRLAHFVDAIKKSRGSNFEEIFRKASYTVRKWHPDYLTLTPFEKQFMRRLMPFYSWTRRAIPLMVEGAILNPGKTVAYPKVIQGLQTSLGVEGVDRSNPFPASQLYPEWIRNMGVGPLLDHPDLGARPGPGGTGSTIINPSNPFYDLVGQFSNPVAGFAEMLHPGIKIPMELLTQNQVLTGAPITDKNLMEYIGNNIPLFSQVQGITGLTPSGGDTARAAKEGNFNLERFINFLTAMGLRGTGPYQAQAAIEQSFEGG